MRVFDAPGAAHLLLGKDVALLHPAEQVFAAMLAGWENNQISRSVAESSIYRSRRLIERVAGFSNEYPWNWVPADAEAFIASLEAVNLGPAKSNPKRGYEGELR